MGGQDVGLKQTQQRLLERQGRCAVVRDVVGRFRLDQLEQGFHREI